MRGIPTDYNSKIICAAAGGTCEFIIKLFTPLSLTLFPRWMINGSFEIVLDFSNKVIKTSG